MITINIQERMEHYKVQGVSIALIKNGQISGTENYGILEANSNRKVNENSIFSACSISKFIAGLTALKLVEEGHLTLDENANDRLVTWKVPENNYTKIKKVTLRNLLSHQSGILDPEGSFYELRSDIGTPLLVELLEGKTPYCKDPIEVHYEPESEFHYSDAGYCIIQQLIEDVTRTPFYQVVNKFIFQPLGMKNSYFHNTLEEIEKKEFSCGHNRKGEVVNGKYPIYPYPTASGVWTTSLDLATLVLELMDAVKGESKIGISKSLAKEMITSQRGKSWTGLGVFLEGTGTELEVTALGWGVGFQCMVVAYPHIEKGTIIMTNTELGVHQMKGIIGEIYKSYI
ncbi:serine hydrolase domain-containing protein [Ferdinandcohnia sp. Marseille-Q9671]